MFPPAPESMSGRGYEGFAERRHVDWKEARKRFDGRQ